MLPEHYTHLGLLLPSCFCLTPQSFFFSFFKFMYSFLPYGGGRHTQHGLQAAIPHPASVTSITGTHTRVHIKTLGCESRTFPSGLSIARCCVIPTPTRLTSNLLKLVLPGSSTWFLFPWEWSSFLRALNTISKLRGLHLGPLKLNISQIELPPTLCLPVFLMRVAYNVFQLLQFLRIVLDTFFSHTLYLTH